MKLKITTPFSTFYDRWVNWFCDKVWPNVDPQEQILGIQLDINNACNLTCDHCYHPHHKNQGALTFEEWLKVLDQHESLTRKLRMVPGVTLCGGEPTLAPFLIPLLKNIRKRFPTCDLNVQSNGTLITPEMAREFKSFNMNLQISLDGPDAERNDIIRGKGNFDKAMAGCRELGENGVPFYHQAVLSHRTLPWIADFFEMAKKTGATDMNFTRLIMEGYAKELPICGKDSPLIGWELKKACRSSVNMSG